MSELGHEAAQGIDYFDCLPEDLLMIILNKIHDLKCLFQCTLVSKGLASKIYRVKSISVKLPAFILDRDEEFYGMCRISRETLRLKRFSEPPPSPCQTLKFTTFLQNFTDLECASFETPCPRRYLFSSPCLNWKAEFGNCDLAVHLVVSALPSTMCMEAESESEEYEDEDDSEEDEDEDEDDDEEGENEENVVETIHTLRDWADHSTLFCFMKFARWLTLVFSVIEQHHSLKTVICTDSCKHWKVVLDDWRIVEWRKKLLCSESWREVLPITVTTGWVPHSDLQLPGNHLSEAFSMVMSFIPVTHHDILESWEYDEEKKLLAAALINGILTKPRRVSLWRIDP